MNTLYDILEVSEKASKEVIEKAYKVLAKKYHPDLQTVENKEMAEMKMKQINEAYEVLSDDRKRAQYDNELKDKRIEELQKNADEGEDNQKKYQTNTFQNENVEKANSNYYKVQDMQRRRYEERLRKEEINMRKQMQANLQKEYENAYYSYLRGLGYRIKEKWTWEKTKKLFLILLIITIVMMALWFLPPTHDMMISFYEDNAIVKVIVDIVIAVFKAFGNIFTSIFANN